MSIHGVSRPGALTNRTLQYASATGTDLLGATAATITPLPVSTLGPGSRLLLQQTSSGATGAFPTPDVTDTTPIAMSTTGGKLALVEEPRRSRVQLSIHAVFRECGHRMIDFVGYGTANYFEGTAAALAPLSSGAIIRGSSNCADSNANSADFARGAPLPRNRASTAAPCAASNLASGVCGNGVREGAEECDDGNSYSSDNCTNTCTLPCAIGCPFGCSGSTCNAITAIGAGGQQTCAIRGSDKAVFCWGNNAEIQQIPGITNATQVESSVSHACALLSNSTVWCWGTDTFGELGNGTAGSAGPTTPVQVSSLTDALQLSLGESHSCAVKATGAVCAGA